MAHTIAVPTLDAGDEFIICATNQSACFSATQLMQPVDEVILDKFMDIQYGVESDSYLKHLDYTMMEMDEISDIVTEYSDII